MRTLPNAYRDFRTRFARKRTKGEMANKQGDVFHSGTPQDVTSVRAKSTRHRKVSADRWNQ